MSCSPLPQTLDLRGRRDELSVEGRASGSENALEIVRLQSRLSLRTNGPRSLSVSHFRIEAAGFEDYAAAPMNWYGVADRAAVWIATGWTEAMIVAETKIVANRAGTPMPLAYFEKVFATAAARAAQPLPIATVKSAETFDVARPNQPAGANRSVGDALTAITRRLEQRRRRGRPSRRRPACPNAGGKMKRTTRRPSA